MKALRCSVVLFYRDTLDALLISARSIVNQKINDLEIILVGGDQSTLTALQGIANGALIQQVGPETTPRDALNFASCEVLALLLAGDEFVEGRLDKFIFEFNRAQRLFGFSHLVLRDQLGNELPSEVPMVAQYFRALVTEATGAPTIGCALMSDDIILSLSNLVIHRDCVAQIPSFSISDPYAALEIALRLLPTYEPLLTKQKLVRVNVPNSQLSERFKKKDPALQRIFSAYFETVESAASLNSLAPSHWVWPHCVGKTPSLSYWIKDFDREKPISSVKKPDHRATSQGGNGRAVTLISHELSLTGAPKVVLDLCRLLKSKGVRVNVIALDTGDMIHELEAEGISVMVIPYSFVKWSQVNPLRKIYRLMRLFFYLLFFTRREVIINSVGSWPVIFPIYFLSKIKKIKLFVHESLSIYSLFPSGLTKRAFRQIGKNSSIGLWFGSDATRKIWAEDGFTGRTIYWSGLSAPISKSVGSTEKKVILTVGTTSARKGIFFLVQAFILLVKEKRISDEVELHLLGFPDNGDVFTSDLLIQIAESGCSNRITFFRSLPPDLIDQHVLGAHLYVQSSVMECLPISLLQAMSYGLPIVTTDVDGCTEAIQDGRNGYVCAARSVETLANAIEKIFLYPDKAVQLGKQARVDFEEKFSLSITESEVLKQLDLT